MEKQESKYGLRARRSEFKGKYREMLGVNASPSSTTTSTNKLQAKENPSQLVEASEKEHKIYVLPIVVSDGSNILEENAIEIEISEDPAECDVSDQNEKTTYSLNPTTLKQSSDPLDHIEEILKQNNQLIQSIPEAPSFKRRKKTEKNVVSSVTLHNDLTSSQSSEASSIPEDVTDLELPSNNEQLEVSVEVVQNLLFRPLSEEEKKLIENLLEDGKKEDVLQTFFGPEAKGRVRKCSLCCCLIEGPDVTYASHYTQTHGCEPVYSCELCDQSSEKSEIYYSHLESHFKHYTSTFSKNMAETKNVPLKNGKETAGEPYVCDICGKTLKHQKSLYSHRRTHTDAKAVCHICGATLKSSRYLHHHLLLHKDIEKPHKCDKCGKAFFSSSALKVHKYYNHEEHPGRFQCTICGKTFKAKQGLQFHMDSHSNELRYECSYCHKKFRGFKTCRVHELRHREANEPNKYSCNICGKFFKTRQTLKNHEDVHASFNRYQCSLCEKRFKLRKSCLAHIRVHHNDQESGNANQTTLTDEGEMAVESLLADGEEYIVTLEDGAEVESVLLQEGGEQSVELIVPEAHVECEVANVT